MNDICKITALIIFLLSLSFGQSKKEKEIIKFLNARYNASLDSVSNYLDQNFIYYHTPYVGMGISSELIDLQKRFRPENVKISPHLIDKTNVSSTKPKIFPVFNLTLKLELSIIVPIFINVLILFLTLFILRMPFSSMDSLSHFL